MSEKSEYKFPSHFPDWDDVDKEYKYRAFDADGELFYYNDTPVLEEESGIFWQVETGTFKLVGKATSRWAQKIWRDSLEQRPE